MTREPTKTSWSSPEILQSIPNPDSELHYVVEITSPEVTFLGVRDQPDFGKVVIQYIAGETVIELKSLKKYFYDFRNRIISYERFISVVFRDLMEKYQPRWLKVTVWFNPRGGIRSKLEVDSSQSTGISSNLKCEVCGKKLKYREGEGRNRKPYKGYFCPDRDCGGKPVWVDD